MRHRFTLVAACLLWLAPAWGQINPTDPRLPHPFWFKSYAQGLKAGIFQPTCITFDAKDRLWVANLAGTIVRLEDKNRDGKADIPFYQFPYPNSKLPGLEGILFVGGDMWVSFKGSTGTVGVFKDTNKDGNPDPIFTPVVTQIPVNYHQNNQLVQGPSGWIYFSAGAYNNAQAVYPNLATILRLDPTAAKPGATLEVYATGLRNCYDICFDSKGNLFAGENGRDDLGLKAPPEEVNPIAKGGFYCFPNEGARTLDWSVSAGESFTTVSPSRGLGRQGAPAPDTIRVSIDRTGLDAGAYADTVRFDSNGGRAAIPISLEVPGTPVWSYTIVDSFPHDRSAFTQGLAVRDGILYEGTGRYGTSYVRALELETGRLVRSKKLRGSYFGEGIALVESLLYQLTLNAGLAMVYEESSFERLYTVSYSSEGWGLAYDPSGDRLVRSDGSERIYFHDPSTFEPLGQVDVYDGDDPVWRLNELEVIGGVLFANVWKTDRLARIDLETGQVLSWVDLTGLEALADYGSRIDVLNGIAYDEASDRLFVTGKLWPVLFEIELIEPEE